MTCHIPCLQPMMLDTAFESDAEHYGVNRRRWVCPLGHTRWEEVERVKVAERPVPQFICKRCNRPMPALSVNRQHKTCTARERKRRQARARMKKARRAPVPARACRSCGRIFTPKAWVNKDCPSCHRLPPCGLCGKRHKQDGRHADPKLQWAITKRSAFKAQIVAQRKGMA